MSVSFDETARRTGNGREITGPNVGIPATTESSTPPNTSGYRTCATILLLSVNLILTHTRVMARRQNRINIGCFRYGGKGGIRNLVGYREVSVGLTLVFNTRPRFVGVGSPCT